MVLILILDAQTASNALMVVYAGTSSPLETIFLTTQLLVFCTKTILYYSAKIIL